MELVAHTLLKNKHSTMNGGHKEIVLGGPLVQEARKVLRKVKNHLFESDFRTYQPEMVQVMNSTGTKAEARIRRREARKVPILNQDVQPQKHPVKKDMVIPGNQTIGIPA